ncbi:hypothetical protein B0H99_11276 [Planomicrobium soli]|uniref:Uncharacterized protein n=1 Tax=Planomicrobium soli TaxID=1176648 RepID=A0A2P8GAX4_9BACL|nr:hypothetical protein [Planomicrobium soli]PSL31126.1 hypothetical protein B0H99_11276 [Planomicrobium soli]
MSFWKFMLAYMIVYFIQLIYSGSSFFQYPHPIYDGFTWHSLGKGLIEITLFSGLLFGFYGLIDRVAKWHMQARYEKAKQERAVE